MGYFNNFYENFYNSYHIADNCAICSAIVIFTFWKILLPTTFMCNHRKNQNYYIISMSKICVSVSISFILFLTIGSVFEFYNTEDNFDNGILDYVVMVTNYLSNGIAVFFNVYCLINQKQRNLEYLGLMKLLNDNYYPNFQILLTRKFIIIAQTISLISLFSITTLFVTIGSVFWLIYPSYSLNRIIQHIIWTISFYYEMAVSAAYILECALYSEIMGKIHLNIKTVLSERLDKLNGSIKSTNWSRCLKRLQRLQRLHSAIYFNIKMYEKYTNPSQVVYIGVSTFTMVFNIYVILKAWMSGGVNMFNATYMFLQIRLHVTAIVLFIVLVCVTILNRKVS